MLNKKLLSLITIIAIFSGACSLVNAQETRVAQSSAKKTLTSVRIAGEDRFETSVNISKECANTEKMEGVILAYGNNFPDALSGSILAQKYRAPVLLCGSTVEESSRALGFIMNSLPKGKTVYILGGTGGIKKDIEDNLKSNGYTVKRLGGEDRYDTNIKVVDEFNPSKGTPVILANGENFPDALSISSAAAVKDYPIILTSKHSISEVSLNKIKRINPKIIYVAGGEASVSEGNLNRIKDILGLPYSSIIRISGKDRYDTSLKIAEFFKLESPNAVIANGENFPDALSGSALASLKRAPIILVDNKEISRQKAFLDQSSHSNLVILGGQGSVSDTIKSLLCGESIEEPTPLENNNSIHKY